MAPKAERNPRWNSGRIIASNGYVLIRVGRDHPLADARGYAYEHLVVWCAAGNPPPPSGFLIHHRDDNRQHNWYGNLELKPRPRHSADHAAQMPRHPDGRFKRRAA